MSLVRTAPTLVASDEPLAEKHRELLLAADELLEARFNRRTWLVFDVAPQLPLGDVCVFGTPANLSVGAYPAYDPADETPPDPSGGSVVSVDTSTQVIWLTGYSDTTTLNRRTVDYNPGTGIETWWVGTIRAQRFEALRIADVCVEAYTDPVAGVDTAFTWRAHWDKYGCVRIHNGNRFSLTLTFEDASQSDVVIPPYGIVCGRRPSHDEPFVFSESWYLPLTLVDDRMTWQANQPGQFAASMENLTLLVEEMGDWVRYVPTWDADSTAREQDSFTGSAPAGTDYLWDWLWHPGKLLSVVLDRRDGTTTVTELEWGGIGSVPDASWAGHVDVSLAMGDTIVFTSDATAPAGAGPTEWEHDLIPITTNMTQGYILALVDGSVSLGVGGGGNSENHYTDPLDLGVLGSSSSNVYSCASGGSPTMLRLSRSLTPSSPTSPSLEATIADWAPAPASGLTGIIKSFGAIGRWGRISASSSDGPSVFDEDLLHRADTSGSTLAWRTAKFISVTHRRRFLPRQARKYHVAGEVSGGAAVYDGHPQDAYLGGTPDGLGGPLAQSLRPVLTSPIRIEGSGGGLGWGPWTRVTSTRGNDIWVPADTLHTVATRINETGWWATNRDRILAGTLEPEDSLIAWRIPRTIEEWNALAGAINAVAEVYRADIRHLYRDPLPGDVDHPPFSYGGESPFCVPADWICGRHDTDDTLADWATLWGVSPSTSVPDLDDLEATKRTVWRYGRNAGGDVCVVESVDYDTIAFSEDTETVNGHTFGGYSVLYPAAKVRALFGGAGEWSDYVYLTRTATKAVFDALGVHVPYPPAGEKFTPTVVADTGYTVINGSIAAGPEAGSSTTWLDVSYILCRVPASDGTWIQVVDGELAGINREGFRLSNLGAGAAPIMWFTNSGDTEASVLERELGSSGAAFGEFSNFAKTLFTSAQTHTQLSDYAALQANAWRSLNNVSSDCPILLIGAPEMYSSVANDYSDGFALVDLPYGPQGLYTVTTTAAPAGGNLRHQEIASPTFVQQGDLAGYSGWTSHAAYHCQVVQRTGVLRA